MQKKCKIKRVGALRGRWIGLQKKCKIKRVGALRGRLSLDCKKSAKLRGLGIKGQVDCRLQKKSAKLRGLGH